MIQELDNYLFRFSNHTFYIPIDIYCNRGKLKEFLLQQQIVGYTRNPPKIVEDCVAMLFLEDEYEVWTHIPEYMLEDLDEAEEDADKEKL